MNESEKCLSKLTHPLKKEAYLLRDVVLKSISGVTEHVKWNAPSFLFGGDDRITFNFTHKTKLRVILHRGVKVKDVARFEFIDKSGLVIWKAKDRGLLELDGTSIKNDAMLLGSLFRDWFTYTAKMD